MGVREWMWIDVCAEEWVCREVYVYRSADTVRGCAADPARVLVPPASSPQTSVLLSLSLWEKLS